MADKRCFVIMPYGEKEDAKGRPVNFDLIYTGLIQPAVTGIPDVDIECIRCDERMVAGSIDDDMFEPIATADIAVVDVSQLNPNVLYELGARHALRPSITVLIGHGVDDFPFNIQNLRIITYSTELAGIEKAKADISDFIANGLEGGRPDSPMQEVLDRLRGEQAEADRRLAQPIEDRKELSFKVGEKRLVIRTGDIRKWPGVDVWVNSENTNMQMARFFDRNLSAVIRFEGAIKDENGEIVEDTIANELAELMRGRESVKPATVFATDAGALGTSLGVKRIFHVASVFGVPSEGYRAVPEIIDDCVTRCLTRMDSDGERAAELRTIVFPMIGTGAGGEDVGKVAKLMIEAAVDYFNNNAESAVEQVNFMAWNERDLNACRAAASAIAGLEPAPPV